MQSSSNSMAEQATTASNCSVEQRLVVRQDQHSQVYKGPDPSSFFKPHQSIFVPFPSPQQLLPPPVSLFSNTLQPLHNNNYFLNLFFLLFFHHPKNEVPNRCPVCCCLCHPRCRPDPQHPHALWQCRGPPCRQHHLWSEGLWQQGV